MTIAEQITRAKADYDEVYQTAHRNGTNEGFTDGYTVGYSNGKASMIDESKIIEKTVTGSIISVDDVSELPHEVGIQLSSGNVTVKAKGNLFNINNGKYSGSSQGTVSGDKITVYQTFAGAYVSYNMEIPDVHLLYGKQITISAKCKKIDDSANTPAIRMTVFNGTSNVSGYFDIYATPNENGEIIASGTVPAQAPTTGRLCLAIYSAFSGTGEVNKPIEYSDITINIGSSAIYTPYQVQAATANADGTVEGIKSISPRMTVFTDNSNVDITMNYHMSYGAWVRWNKDWDNKQKHGTQRNYWGAFTSGYNDNNFDPKYSIIATDCSYMFMYTGITYINVDIDLGGCAQVSNLMPYTYGTVKRVKKIILKNDGSQSFSNAFAYASGLTEIFFDGVIGKDISFAQSTLLNEASFINIFEHFSTTATFTATFAKNAVINTFGSTTAAKWTNLVASRPNVTIALA